MRRLLLAGAAGMLVGVPFGLGARWELGNLGRHTPAPVHAADGRAWACEPVSNAWHPPGYACMWVTPSPTP